MLESIRTLCRTASHPAAPRPGGSGGGSGPSILPEHKSRRVEDLRRKEYSQNAAQAIDNCKWGISDKNARLEEGDALLTLRHKLNLAIDEQVLQLRANRDTFRPEITLLDVAERALDNFQELAARASRSLRPPEVSWERELEILVAAVRPLKESNGPASRIPSFAPCVERINKMLRLCLDFIEAFEPGFKEKHKLEPAAG